MKILTLNAHSFFKKEYEVRELADAITFEKPDIIALQEVDKIEEIVEMIEKKGVKYYHICNQGIGLMSLSPILETSIKCISESKCIIGIRTEKSLDEWFFNVSYDEDEPFMKQWQKTKEHLKDLSDVWLIGEFNSPANIRGEGYDEMCYDGWKDSFLFAGEGKVAGKIWFKNKKIVDSYRMIFDGKNYPVVCDHTGVMVAY